MVARQLGVCHQIVSDWRNAWRRSGRDGLRGTGRAGRLPKLSPEQLVQVESALIQGAEANGYPHDLWTLQRAAQVIQRVTGVSHHPARVWYILRHGLDWTLATASPPSDRTQRRSHPAVGQEALAAVEKRARRQNALIVFEDESGVSLLPSVRATWAPRGCTPVLRHRFAWKRLSLAGALAYEPDGSDAHLLFELRPGAYNDTSLACGLRQWITLVCFWDGAPRNKQRRSTKAPSPVPPDTFFLQGTPGRIESLQLRRPAFSMIACLSSCLFILDRPRILSSLASSRNSRSVAAWPTS